jgi:hypothetical protein
MTMPTTPSKLPLFVNIPNTPSKPPDASSALPPLGRVIAASVLCFAVCDSGNIYFLLGKENSISGCIQGSKADSWSDFGGRAAVQDANEHDVAAREFMEESMGLVRFLPGASLDCASQRKRHYDHVAQELAAGKYLCSLSISMSSCTRHVCYLKQVAWQPELPLKFLRMRRAFLRIRNVSKKMAWMLRRNNGQRLHTLDWLAHRCVTKDYMATGMTLLRPGNATSPGTVVIRYAHWRPEESAISMTMLLLPHQTEHDVQRYNSYLGLVSEIQMLHRQLPTEWQTHPALKFTHWRHRIVRIVVCRHHLEMQCLRWWSLPYLHELIQCHGRYRKNVIRPCFVPTLRLMLDYLAANHRTHNLVFTDWQQCATEANKPAHDTFERERSLMLSPGPNDAEE